MPAAPTQFVRYVTDQLQRWAPVSVRRLFGGHALYRGNSVFAIVSRETLYFRTDDLNRSEFEAAGAAPFQPGGRVRLPYHEVPVEVIEDPDDLARWAESAVAAAARRDAAKAKKPPRKRRA